MLCKFIPLTVLLAFTGCSPEGEDHETADSQVKGAPVVVGLATVVGQTITAVDVDRYERSLPPNLHSKKEGVAAYREYLQSLVDKELVLYEAKKRGLDQLPGLE